MAPVLASPADELSDVLLRPDPTDGLRRLVDSGWADVHLPELPALSIEQDPIHRHKDVFEHTLVVTANTSPRLRLRLSALLHDIAKPATKRVERQRVTFYHHEAVGSRITRKRLSALGYDQELTDDVARLVELSGRFHGYSDGWTDAAVRRYARDAGHLLGDLNELVRCDCTTRRPERVRALQRKVDAVEARIRALAEQEADAVRNRPPLDGAAVMEILGIDAGPTVGLAMKWLTEQTSAGNIDDVESATSSLLAWWERNTPAG